MADIISKLFGWYSPRHRFRVPESYSDITIKQYHELRNAVSRDTDRLIQISHMVSILCGISYEKAIKLPSNILLRVFLEMSFLDNSITTSKKFNTRFKIGPYFYHCAKLEEMTAAQYITVKELVKDFDNKLAEICACFILREGVEFSDKSFKENAEVFYKHLNVQLAHDVSVFFCLASQKLSRTFHDYLLEEAKNQINSAIQALKTDGDGQ